MAAAPGNERAVAAPSDGKRCTSVDMISAKSQARAWVVHYLRRGPGLIIPTAHWPALRRATGHRTHARFVLCAPFSNSTLTLFIHHRNRNFLHTTSSERLRAQQRPDACCRARNRLPTPPLSLCLPCRRLWSARLQSLVCGSLTSNPVQLAFWIDCLT